jgi:hypothetical protein
VGRIRNHAIGCFCPVGRNGGPPLSLETSPLARLPLLAGRPILVTGMPRSGTTWVGQMLAAGGEVMYLSEPLNQLHPGIFRLRVRQPYCYIDEENESSFADAFADAAAARPRPVAEIFSVREAKDVGRVAVRSFDFVRARLRSRRILFKDPYAVFSADWFADRLGSDVVLVVRRPAAVVSSLKRLGWRAPLVEMRRQEALRKRWLVGFDHELEAAATRSELRRDLIWSNTVLWLIVYGAVARYADTRRNFIVVRHEDLSRDPEHGFAQLYQSLGLSYSARAIAHIRGATAAGNPREVTRRHPHRVRLDSGANLESWRRRLTPEEVKRIRSMTDALASRWYDVENLGPAFTTNGR